MAVSAKLIWNPGEPFEDFQRRMEPLCQKRKGVLDYETQRFKEGWMWVDWATYAPFSRHGEKYKERFVPKTDLAKAIYTALESKEGRFSFDDKTDLWKPKESVNSITEICSRLNPRLASFLEAYRGQGMLLNRMALMSYRNMGWTKEWQVSWFLKRPGH